LNNFIKLEHEVVAAQWQEEQGTWSVQIKDLSTGETVSDWCHFLINGGGFLKYVTLHACADYTDAPQSLAVADDPGPSLFPRHITAFGSMVTKSQSQRSECRSDWKRIIWNSACDSIAAR
jgi:hypothetical protein